MSGRQLISFPLGKYPIDDNDEAMHTLEINAIKVEEFGLPQEFWVLRNCC